MRRGALFITGTVIIHHVLVATHRESLEALAVYLVGWQNAFMTTVVIVLPLVGAGLTWTTYRRIGYGAVIISALGACVFGITQHVSLTSPDQVHLWATQGASAYVTLHWTAAALALIEGIAAVSAAYCLGCNDTMAAGAI